MKTVAIGTTAVAMDTTPLAARFNCVAVNLTASSISLTGCDTAAGTFTALATVAAGTMVNIDSLPNYVKSSAASVYLLG